MVLHLEAAVLTVCCPVILLPVQTKVTMSLRALQSEVQH